MSVYSFTSASSGFVFPCSVRKYVKSTSIRAGGPGLRSYGLVVFLDFLNSISYDLIISIFFFSLSSLILISSFWDGVIFLLRMFRLCVFPLNTLLSYMMFSAGRPSSSSGIGGYIIPSLVPLYLCLPLTTYGYAPSKLYDIFDLIFKKRMKIIF